MADDGSSRSAVIRVVVLLVALGAVVAMIVWMQRRSAGPDAAVPSAATGSANEQSWEARLIRSAQSAEPARPMQRTVKDKRRRDELRELIYKAYGRTPPSTPARPKQGAAYHAPLGTDAGKISPEYVQQRIREDFVPLAKQCYEAALERDPEVAGKLVLSFVIVGDEDVGGIVESADVDDQSTIKDEDFQLCMRESMLSLSFVAPENGGSVTVTYPFLLHPGDGG